LQIILNLVCSENIEDKSLSAGKSKMWRHQAVASFKHHRSSALGKIYCCICRQFCYNV